MSTETRTWHRAAAGLAIALLVAGCGGSSATPTPAPTPTVATTPTSAPTPTATPAPTAGLWVDPDSDEGPISPFVYGSNIGPTIWPPFEFQDQLKAAKLTTLTFPGGNWGDQYDIRTFNLDQFVAYCRILGAEPRVVVRLLEGTPEQAAELVRYANVEKGYAIKYWGIGNEPDLYASAGIAGYGPEQYNVQWRAIAKAMLAVDPSIKLTGPDVSQFSSSTDPYIQARADWLSSFLKANGDLLSIVSIHRYPLPKDINTPITVDDLRAGGQEWDKIIPTLRGIIKTQTGKDLPVAITEINSSWAASSGTDYSLDSHMNAIWFADVLGHMIEQKVFMVDQFAIATEYGIVRTLGLSPIYYDYLMYAQFGTELVRSASDDPMVGIYASKRSDGTLTLMVVNLSATPQTKPLTIAGSTATSAEQWLFDKTHKAEKTGTTQLGGSLTFPAESVTLLVLKP